MLKKNDDERKANENPVIGIVLCQDADKPYVEYLLQDYNQLAQGTSCKELQLRNKTEPR